MTPSFVGYKPTAKAAGIYTPVHLIGVDSYIELSDFCHCTFHISGSTKNFSSAFSYVKFNNSLLVLQTLITNINHVCKGHEVYI